MNPETTPCELTRRTLLGTAGAVLLAAGENAQAVAAEGPAVSSINTSTQPEGSPGQLPDLRPARWLWYPSERSLQNTFVFLRRSLRLSSAPRQARGWVTAGGRYLLSVNGRRIQWGTAPCDPRWLEADPVDLTKALQAGDNVIGATVFYPGVGDGTWPAGKPGFLFWMELKLEDGRIERVVSDASWRICLARCWQPGHFKRDYLRALQEVFDARRYPEGWNTPAFVPNHDWIEPMMLDIPPDKPPICSGYSEYQYGFHADRARVQLRPRTIPLLDETPVAVKHLAESFWLRWLRPAEEYFEFIVPKAYEVDRSPSFVADGDGIWRVDLDGERTASGIFEFAEQVVGWPHFTIEAPAGTVVELLVHEAHRVGGPALLNTHWSSWSRLICKEGVNHFEAFEYESTRWIQLLVRNARGRVRIRDLGVRRRLFPWPHAATVTCGEPALQRLMEASINTLYNCAQDSLVDGMARERQQYSGDCGHQTHAIYMAFGETRLPARYLRTFSQGMTVSGYFMDCWPAFDRMSRCMARQVELAGWGPILDHGVGFNFDCLHHYLYTGDLKSIEEPYPRLLRFNEYLRSIVGRDGLLPVDNLGVPMVWIDHQAYREWRHKQCAFNLYTAAMLMHAQPVLSRAFGRPEAATEAEAFGRELLAAAVKTFWSEEHTAFIINRPWLSQEKDQPRMCDRSLATAILFDQCPDHRIDAAVKALVEMPESVGGSYPANAGWRLWALAKVGRTDVVLKDLRERWATMDSVRLNNTLQEDWRVTPDSGSQWSHCAVVPLYVMYMNIAGIRPLEPGFARCEIRPQPADMEALELIAHTVRGPIRFASQGRQGNRRINIALPEGCVGRILLDRRETVGLTPAEPADQAQLRAYRLPAGQSTALELRHT